MMGLVAAEAKFRYIYAILHSSTYRKRYANQLKRGYPRVPQTGHKGLAKNLSRLGHSLIALHLMESHQLDHLITTYSGPQNLAVGRVGWSDDTVWLDAAAAKKVQRATPGTIGFRGVPEAVWKFHIGGYQVCEKWLKDRKGRTLFADDIAHYQKIVVALSETIRLMQEIDEVIEQHGGWPAAFAQGDAKADEATAADNVVALPLSKSTESAYKAAPVPLQKVAEPETKLFETGEASVHDGSGLHPDDLDREDLICRIRQMFGDGEERERDDALEALARELGRQNVGDRVQQDIEEALQIAIGRSILSNEGRTLRLAARQIQQYERNLLKEQFLASLSGKPWIERDDAVRAFARWMGFRRTGRSIDETARSLINGLVREKRIERNGSRIRVAE